MRPAANLGRCLLYACERSFAFCRPVADRYKNKFCSQRCLDRWWMPNAPPRAMIAPAPGMLQLADGSWKPEHMIGKRSATSPFPFTAVGPITVTLPKNRTVTGRHGEKVQQAIHNLDVGFEKLCKGADCATVAFDEFGKASRPPGKAGSPIELVPETPEDRTRRLESYIAPVPIMPCRACGTHKPLSEFCPTCKP